MGNIKSITAGIFGATHLFAAPVTATVIDFNAAPSLSNGGLSIGNPYVEDGYQLSVLTGFGILSMQAGAQSNRFSNNGTTSAYVYSNSSNPPPAFQLSKVGGSAFSLLSIDVAELFNNGDSAFPFAARNVSFTGHLSGGGTVMAGFNLDLISDGVGGLTDFETVNFSPAWSNLSSVDISSTSTLSNGAFLNFDNIVVEMQTTAMPEPGTLAILGLGLVGLGIVRRKRSA